MISWCKLPNRTVATPDNHKSVSICVNTVKRMCLNASQLILEYTKAAINPQSTKKAELISTVTMSNVSRTLSMCDGWPVYSEEQLDNDVQKR